MNTVDARQHLIKIYRAGLEAVQGRRCTCQRLLSHPLGGSVYVVAIGKAAGAMFLGAREALGDRLAGALVITKFGHGQGLPASDQVTVLEAGHPWPTRASLEAGDALLAFVSRVPGDGRMLFLISGGASALVEVLAPGITLDDWIRMNDWLLASGLDIHAMNRLRKAVSCIKGGRLARHVGDRPTTVLLISDVPGDDPATIGSGLLAASAVTAATDVTTVPPWIAAMVEKGVPAPAATASLFDRIDVEIIASPEQAKHAAAAQGRALGYPVFEHREVLQGDALEAGRRLAAVVAGGSPGLHIWGGETTVTLPPHPGRGGRNQSLALAAAGALAGVPGVALLAVGTDGTDGPTEDAGALVDGGTLTRGEAHGLNAVLSLANADAGTFLAASDDLIQTGPTGTNVMDLVLGLKWPDA